MAAKISTEEASGDVFRVNKDQNIMVVSTPVLKNAQRYRGIVEILLDGKRFGVAAYTTPPENTAKGVIHGIPEEDTEEHINGNLIGARNPSILQARRMGHSGSVVIVFEGKKVPYFVRYGATEKKCFLHKKKIECCGQCGRVGHRTDVCPRPEERRCKGCWTLNPPAEHECTPACGVCGKAHPTGDQKCKKKFKTPYIVLQRSWEKKRNKQGLLKQGEENFPKLLGDASRSRSRSRAEGRRSRSTSRTGGRRQSGSRSGGERHVRWAEMVSRKAPQNKRGNAFAETSQANELAEIKALLKQALEENKALREELNRLKEGTRERVEVVHATQETISAESDGGELASPPLKRRARVTARPRGEAREAKPVSGDQETFVTKNMLESAITGCMERMLTELQSRASRLAQGTPNPFDAWAHYTRVTGNITRPETEAMINEDGSEP
ncbi:hypothetical protein ISCGN_013172 [Ixodes scapularis]